MPILRLILTIPHLNVMSDGITDAENPKCYRCHKRFDAAVFNDHVCKPCKHCGHVEIRRVLCSKCGEFA